jgi:ribosomal protein S18 acetylase RimI-like enzyme
VADIKSPALAAFKKEICDFASGLTAETESAFARVHPEAVGQEHFLAACAPLFEKGFEQVDWQAVRDTIKKTVTDFYHMDISSFGEEVLKPLMADLWFFATIKSVNGGVREKLGPQNAHPAVPAVACEGWEPVEGSKGANGKPKTGELLGFVQFAVTPALAQGEVKLMQVTVAPSARDRGLEQLLLGLIFKLIPGTKRLFTGVRPTNIVALEQLHACGFVPDMQSAQDPNHPINPDCWTGLQYISEQSKLVQDAGERLREAK